MTLRDAYAMGRYVGRHFGTQGARDRIALAVEAEMRGRRWVAAFWLGRDRFARMGEY